MLPKPKDVAYNYILRPIMGVILVWVIIVLIHSSYADIPADDAFFSELHTLGVAVSNFLEEVMR